MELRANLDEKNYDYDFKKCPKIPLYALIPRKPEKIKPKFEYSAITCADPRPIYCPFELRYKTTIKIREDAHQHDKDEECPNGAFSSSVIFSTEQLKSESVVAEGSAAEDGAAEDTLAKQATLEITPFLPSDQKLNQRYRDVEGQAPPQQISDFQMPLSMIPPPSLSLQQQPPCPPCPVHNPQISFSGSQRTSFGGVQQMPFGYGQQTMPMSGASMPSGSPPQMPCPPAPPQPMGRTPPPNSKPDPPFMQGLAPPPKPGPPFPPVPCPPQMHIVQQPNPPEVPRPPSISMPPGKTVSLTLNVQGQPPPGMAFTMPPECAGGPTGNLGQQPAGSTGSLGGPGSSPDQGFGQCCPGSSADPGMDESSQPRRVSSPTGSFQPTETSSINGEKKKCCPKKKKGWCTKNEDNIFPQEASSEIKVSKSKSQT